ncbi:MAG: hypothetical protein K5851_08190 [Lachnospiraceae bacterium]|nr:hypothetical protein [Lachnospiraceae bacterium]
MKEVIEQYGKIVICAVTTILVFGLLFFENSSVNVKKSMKESADKTVDSRLDEKKSDVSTKKGKPSVQSMEGLVCNKDYKAKELIRGEGITVSKIINVMNEKDENIPSSESEIRFQKAGIYRASIYVEDSTGKYGTLDLYLGVGE